MRPLDHCVLPISALDTTRARLTALGFTVDADAVHPFGTENACVFFADNTYLEPLAIAQREDCERTAQKGNQFTFRDQAFRFRNGENGFSAMALATENADLDHTVFRKEGISAGRKLLFGRTMTSPEGEKARATFKLAFAADPRSPDSFVFSCQRVGVPKIERSALQSHANCVTGIGEVIASEINPTDFQYFLQTVMDNRETHAHSFGMSIKLSNCELDVMTPEGLTARFGVQRKSVERGLRFEGIVFRTTDLEATDSCLKAGGIKPERRGNVIVVDNAEGQGAFFAFKQD